ncbi:sensor histidine kinase [Pukyongiella litopenaei]|uniref:C4-dicarboxylate transport sensor protein DctB n=2 Tax=Pukyongiella litopenaei TaxID=2605946 RepID=A0A2S0ML04_9RHOB|nr:ATP-binding protein [Pukyongiella litopenaei]AVO36565.1 sensor histidine kinase [Pukyongiella litopenaei]
MSTKDKTSPLGRIWPRNRPMRWSIRLAVGAVLSMAIVTVWVTNDLLTDRFTASTRSRAELRLALYGGNLLSELRRNAIVPQLLARDPTLIGALDSSDFSRSTQRLISFVEEIGAESLMLLDLDGRTVAATDRNRLGAQHRSEPYFVDALRSNATIFSVIPREAGGYRFTYSRRIENGSNVLGVIVVEVDLQKFERAWAGVSDAVLVTDSQGTIILATESRWRGLAEAEAIRREPPQGAIDRAIRATADWATLPAEAYLRGEAVMRLESRIPFHGWRMTSFTTYSSVREKVNAVLAMEIMGFAILAALAFYALGRKTALRMALFQRESAELRELNARLKREISERERVQETLAVTEQSLAQSSKLAALGEMSAAVSHELNQPLAAMKTYLAGARLLLRRNRPDEALSSFGRIDDLIERMGAITRQLKSYARKGSESLSAVDMGEALASSLTMMEPQLRHRQVQITRILPDDPVLVMGDRLRIEQVMVNLLRNALDATKTVDDPEVQIILAAGETATLTVRDNGDGVEDFESLFEPFYTTKQPGDGVGLGLAISSGIVSDLGGRLTARNGANGGAVFEMQLPILETGSEAAE